MATMTTRYFAPLNLPFTLDFSSELSQYTGRHDLYRGTLHQPLVDFLAQRSLRISLAEVLRRAAGTGNSSLISNGVHIDRKVRMVWTYGQGASKIAWYSVNSGDSLLSYHKDNLYYHVASTDNISTPLAESTMSVPMLIDAGTFNRVESVDQVRHSFNFEILHLSGESLQWDDAVSLLGSHLTLD